MTSEQLNEKLEELRTLPHETEWVEFKHNLDDPQEIGEYLSALSNAAALESEAFGYIVWSVQDGTHDIVGTTFKPRRKKAKGKPFALVVQKLGGLRCSTRAGLGVPKSPKALLANRLSNHLTGQRKKKLGVQLGQCAIEQGEGHWKISL